MFIFSNFTTTLTPSIKSQHEGVSKLHLYNIVIRNTSGILYYSVKVIFS